MKKLNIYFDFEFTSLSPDAQPISLGIVTDDIPQPYTGQFTENEPKPRGYSFYSEFNDFDINHCDDWVKENVVGKLKYRDLLEIKEGFSHDLNNISIPGNTENLKKALAEWLSQFSDYEIQFVKDQKSSYGTGLDWMNLVDLIRIDNQPKDWSYIKLTRNYLAMVDRDKFKILSKYNWHSNSSNSNPLNVYAVSRINGKQTKMHRFLLGDPPFKGACVDHINGNSLDNRISNLRWVTHAQNNMNVRPSKSKCKFKGICFRDKINKYEARITDNGKTVVIGYYDTEIDAAKAYNKKSIEVFGEYARPNQLSGLPKLPANISPVPLDLNDLILYKHLNRVSGMFTAKDAFNVNRETLMYLLDDNKQNNDLYEVVDNTYTLKENGKHNALFDAKVIKAIYSNLRKP